MRCGRVGETCVLAILGLLAIPAAAYWLTGYYWSSVEIEDLELWMPSGDAHYSAWGDSYSAWNGLDTPLHYDQVPGLDDAKVVCYSQNYGQTGWDGRCNLALSGYEITHATNQLNTYYTSGYGYNKVRSVATHELGHTPGLDHETGAVVMNGVTSSRYDTWGVYTPQQDDEDGINAMYG